MDLEDKLDEDYLFYLGFTSSFIHKFTDPEEKALCNAWLQALCGEKCPSVDRKRNRNIFLSNLVLCMQEGRLTKPFDKPPYEVDLNHASEYFGVSKVEVQQPDWLEEVVGEESSESEEPDHKKDGRTYVATRTMPSGEGAFAYVAISLAEEEPKWLGGYEGAFDMKMQEKFPDYCPVPTEMEMILAKRKDPKERQKVLTFYDLLLKDIAAELDDEVPPNENDTINGLLEQLTNDLKEKQEWCQFACLNEKDKRIELLMLLYDRVYSRREKVAKREDVLDDVALKVLPKSFWDTTIQPDDKFELPSAMWEQAINKAPQKRFMDLLQKKYPLGVIERFLEYLSNFKEELAIRLQKRHEHIVSQMRKELRKEGEKGRKRMEEAQLACDQAMAVLKSVKAARNAQLEAEKELKPKKKGGQTGKSMLYEEMRAALFDTQCTVEEEAKRGRILSDQINAIAEQTEVYHNVNEQSILKAEETNMAIMKNIKRLRLSVKQHEERLTHLKTIAEHSLKTQGAKKMYIF